MSDISITADNEAKYTATSDIDGFELRTDAQGKTDPSPNEILVADYAQCFSYAFRATAARGDADETGAIRTVAEADLDGDDDLASVSFTIHTETDYDDATVADLVAGAEDLCHVHAAVREELHADVSVEAGSL